MILFKSKIYAQGKDEQSKSQPEIWQICLVSNGVGNISNTTKCNKAEFKFRHHFVLMVVSSVFGFNNGFCYKYIYVVHLIYF